MKLLFLAILALAPLTAAAQQPPPAPETSALGQMLIEGMQREASLRTQLITTQAEIERLKAPPPKRAEDKP